MNLNPFQNVAFRCVRCGGSAVLEADCVRCADCAAVFPGETGSLDFIGPYTREGEPDPSRLADVTMAVCKTLELPPQAHEAVAGALAASFDRTGISYIDAEIAALSSRFGQDLGSELPSFENERSEPQDLAFIRHFSPPIAPRRTTISRSVRLRVGEALRPDGRQVAGFGYRWRRPYGGPLARAIDDVRNWLSAATPVPIALSPGREVTLPVRIRTPRALGRYELTIHPTVNGRVRPGVDMRFDVEIVADVPGLPVGAVVDDYGRDHQNATAMLREYLGAHRRAASLVLEVASGVNPHALPLIEDGHTVIATDVCSNQMRLGAIFAEYNLKPFNHALGFAAADAFNAPFQPAQFDGVVMYSALHHFPDPVAFLQRLAALVRDGGFIGVFCEPCSPFPYGGAYMRDLSAGINEQVFSVEEYRQILQSAGLTEHDVRNDGGSFKAILIVDRAAGG